VVTNTLLANNVGGNCFAPLGHLKDGGHNLDDGATCGFTAAGSLSNTDPQPDPAGLADNGGPTQTIAVQAGSPAINAGDETVCESKLINSLDQRGYVRPGTGATACTIGAYEFNSPGCPTGLTACGPMNVCSNLQKDADNCGACGKVCAAGQKCSKGTCR
jgi:hypothetical protein